MHDLAGIELALLIDDLVERGPLDVFHDEECRGGAVPDVLQMIMDFGNTVMPQRAQHRGLALEQLVRLPVSRGPGMKHLDGDVAIRTPVAREKGVAECPLTELPTDLVSVGDEFARVVTALGRRGLSGARLRCAHRAQPRPGIPCDTSFSDPSWIRPMPGA